MDTSTRIIVTGARGFLGWHLCTRLKSLGYENVALAGREEFSRLAELVEGADVVFHLAGINRDEDDVVENGNRVLAEKLRDAFGKRAPRAVVYANTIHADADTPYGRGKSAVAEVLRAWMDSTAGSFVDVLLPNLFGEHGRPFYNSFVATFVELVVRGREPEIQDREVPLLHVQDAAQSLIDAASVTTRQVKPVASAVRVSEVWKTLREQHALYSVGTIPDISEPLQRDLFNTLRARMFVDRPAIELEKHTDDRGSFVETARVRGGQSQTSFSTTEPGITRGEHYHLRKAERFVVLSGRARISIAKVFGDASERVELDVDGARPTAVDMPTGWAHSITNTGEQTLITQFWISELFDPADPDTVRSEVTLR